jgi:hypothetical protein
MSTVGMSLARREQRFVQLEPRHPRHAHVRDQACHAAATARVEEGSGIGKGGGGESGRFQQIAGRPTHRLVVVDDRYERLVGTVSPSGVCKKIRGQDGDAIAPQGAHPYDFGIAPVTASIGNPSRSAMRTRSGSERARILRITWPRCTLT